MVELGFDEYEDFLNIFVSPKHIQYYIVELVDNIEKATLLTSNGFGVTIGNSINDIWQFLKLKGYNLSIAEFFIERFHTKLMEFYRAEQK